MKYKYPFTKQEGLKNCACACMQMIIKYYKGYMSMDELSEYLNTDKQGTSAFKIVELFKKIGFESEGIKTNLECINKENIVLPVIAYVTINSSFKHYVVIYHINFKKKLLTIADPQDKIKSVSFDDFEKIWNNILITMYPIKPIVKNNEVKLKNILFSIIKEYKKNIFQLLLMSFIIMILALVTSFYIKILFDSIDKSKSFLLFVFLFFLTFNIFKILINYLRTRLLIFINEKIDISLNMDIYKKVIYLPYQYYRNRTTGEIISKITDIGKIRELINSLILTMFMDLPLTVFSAITLYIINEKLFFISLIVLISYLVIYFVSKRILLDKTDKCYESKANMTSYMFESINGFETVKGLNIEKKAIKKHENNYIKYLKEIVSLDKFLNNQNLFKELINNLSDLIIIYVGIILVIDNEITIGTLLAFNSILGFFFTPIREIISLDLVFAEASKAMKKAYEILTIDKNKLPSKILNGDIKINNLNYIYNFDKKVLKNINLVIKEGEKVVITGHSGSGKSTLLKIFMKYYKIGRGIVLIGDNDINDVGNIKDSITYISQDEILFTDTLYNNINIVNRDIDRFTDVAKLCLVDEIVKDNSLGYHMVIEENGFNISGGQRQRIILARALLSNFNILLIDEGLNQVDISLERKILKNIFKKYKNKTIIFISHRLENLDLYDHLVELNDGVILKDEVRCKA